MNSTTPRVIIQALVPGRRNESFGRAVVNVRFQSATRVARSGTAGPLAGAGAVCAWANAKSGVKSPSRAHVREGADYGSGGQPSWVLSVLAPALEAFRARKAKNWLKHFGVISKALIVS